jgi:hypothetical protein
MKRDFELHLKSCLKNDKCRISRNPTGTSVGNGFFFESEGFAPCWKISDVSEVLAASIKRAMSAVTKKIFMLATVTASNEKDLCFFIIAKKTKYFFVDIC